MQNVFLTFFSCVFSFISDNLPVFLEEPESTVIRHHDAITLPCKVLPSRAVVRWKFNGDYVVEGDSRGFSFNQTDLHIAKFRHKPKSESNEGIYQCIASTEIGSVASRPARLSKTGQYKVKVKKKTSSLRQGFAYCSAPQQDAKP